MHYYTLAIYQEKQTCTVFSLFQNISETHFVILLILTRSFCFWDILRSCQDEGLV